jgi:hypothetical protein
LRGRQLGGRAVRLDLHAQQRQADPASGEKNWSASVSVRFVAVHALEAPKPSMRW